ncbi:MAG: hypothetical protein GVY18_00735, partial [Bacteroidetes bacterium]|nr:hypothetical protein [Bacteroidota bacterium]
MEPVWPERVSQRVVDQNGSSPLQWRYRSPRHLDRCRRRSPNTSIEKRIEYDLYYIQNWSLLLDLKIMWMTLWRG